MAFEPYITYAEYVDLGGTVSTDAFTVLERKAQRWLDKFTFNRIPYLTRIPDEVKEVLVEIIGKLHSYNLESEGGDTISQYSNGIEKITYRRTTDRDLQRAICSVATEWLPEYLICRGVNFDVEEYLQSESNNPQ